MAPSLQTPYLLSLLFTSVISHYLRVQSHSCKWWTASAILFGTSYIFVISDSFDRSPLITLIPFPVFDPFSRNIFPSGHTWKLCFRDTRIRIRTAFGRRWKALGSRKCRQIREKDGGKDCQACSPRGDFVPAEKGSYRFNSPGKATGGKACATRTLRGLSFVRGAPTMKFFCSAISGYSDNSANFIITEDNEKRSER